MGLALLRARSRIEDNVATRRIQLRVANVSVNKTVTDTSCSNWLGVMSFYD